jgi:predicted N-acetyltransferase YhbS
LPATCKVLYHHCDDATDGRDFPLAVHTLVVAPEPVMVGRSATALPVVSSKVVTMSPYQHSAFLPSDHDAVEHLLDLAFGPNRRTKTSYRLREGSTAVVGLSHVVREAGMGIVGAISYWPLAIGAKGTKALLLGPLAVHPQRQNLGIGLLLMRETLAVATAQGHRLVLLVGDAPYYARVGFQQVPEGQLLLPGPVDPKRLLYLDLVERACAEAQGLVVAAHRHT